MALKDLIGKYENAGNFSRTGWFRLKDDGDSANVRILIGDETDMERYVYEVHRIKIDGYDKKVKCLGQECPMCAGGDNPSLRIWIPLKNHDAGADEPEIQIWERGLTDIKKLLSIIEEYGALNQRDFKIKRIGKAGSTSTTYDFFPRDKEEIELPEPPEILGKKSWYCLDLTADEMRLAMEGKFTLRVADNVEDDGDEFEEDERVF